MTKSYTLQDLKKLEWKIIWYLPSGEEHPWAGRFKTPRHAEEYAESHPYYKERQYKYKLEPWPQKK